MQAAVAAFALVLAGMASTRASAGVRVDEPKPVSSITPFDAPRRSNVQLGVGPGDGVSRDIAGAGRGGGWTATAAIERVASSEWSWVARSEYARFEKSGTFEVPQPGILPTLGPGRRESRTTITTLELGARYSPTSGALHPYFEVAAGCGRHENFQAEDIPNAHAREDDFSTRKYRGTVDVALGGAWQPLEFPLGMFFEARLIGEPGRDGALWFAPHLGLLALLPSTR